MSTVSANFAAKATKYDEFARSTNDFFGRDFPSGLVKLEARTMSKSLFANAANRGLKSDTFSDEFKLTATRDIATGAVAAEVKSTSNFSLLKDKIDVKNVSTLTSNNQLIQQMVFSNPTMEGLKLDVTGTIQSSGPHQTKVGVELAQPAFVISTGVDLFRGPVLTSDISTRFRDVQVGAEMSYDVALGRIDKYTAAIAFDRLREKVVLQAGTGLSTLHAYYFQRFNDQVEVAFKSSWTPKISSVAMEVGAKYYLIGGGFLKAKLDNVGRLGVALASDLRPGVQLTLGASIDTAKLVDNAHKFGLDLTYAA